MNKRGELEVELIFFIDLIILVAVFIAFLNGIIAVGQNTDFKMKFSAKNAALMADSVATSPYPMHLYYNENTYGYDFSFKKEYVEVIDNFQKATYPYIPDINKQFEEKTIYPIEIEDKETEKTTPIVFVSDRKNLGFIAAIPSGEKSE